MPSESNGCCQCSWALGRVSSARCPAAAPTTPPFRRAAQDGQGVVLCGSLRPVHALDARTLHLKLPPTPLPSWNHCSAIVSVGPHTPPRGVGRRHPARPVLCHPPQRNYQAPPLMWPRAGTARHRLAKPDGRTPTREPHHDVKPARPYARGRLRSPQIHAARCGHPACASRGGNLSPLAETTVPLRSSPRSRPAHLRLSPPLTKASASLASAGNPALASLPPDPSAACPPPRTM